MDSQDKKPAKKTYDSPRLVVYGDIRTITQTRDNAGNDDTGSGRTDKT